MQSIAAWLYSIVAALANRVLISLGFGFLTLGGSLWYIKSQLDSQIDQYLGDMWPDVYQIAALAGFVDAIGIWLGAITTVLTFLALKRLVALA